MPASVSSTSSTAKVARPQKSVLSPVVPSKLISLTSLQPQSPRARSRSPEKTVIRSKVLCVPYVITLQKRVRFLIVKDAVFQEYTFISGGLKRNEPPAVGAVRELREETRDAVNISLTQWNHRTFKLVTDSREPKERDMDKARGERVLTTYYVFVVDITNYKSITAILEGFKRSTKTGKAYMECDAIAFETLDQLKKRTLWSFIKNQVLPHPDFKKIYTQISKGCVA